MHARACVCARACVYVCLHNNMYMCAHVCVHVYVCMCMCVRARVYVCMCECAMCVCVCVCCIGLNSGTETIAGIAEEFLVRWASVQCLPFCLFVSFCLFEAATAYFLATLSAESTLSCALCVCVSMCLYIKNSTGWHLIWLCCNITPSHLQNHWNLFFSDARVKTFWWHSAFS